MTHVPYRGSGPMVTDLLGGQVQVAFDSMPSALQHIRAGKLRALGVTTTTRSEALPDIPSVGEFVPGYRHSCLCAHTAMVAPLSTRYCSKEVNH